MRASRCSLRRRKKSASVPNVRLASHHLCTIGPLPPPSSTRMIEQRCGRTCKPCAETQGVPRSYATLSSSLCRRCMYPSWVHMATAHNRASAPPRYVSRACTCSQDQQGGGQSGKREGSGVVGHGRWEQGWASQLYHTGLWGSVHGRAQLQGCIRGEAMPRGLGLQVDGLTRLMLGGHQDGADAPLKGQNRRETWCPGAVGDPLPLFPCLGTAQPFHSGNLT